jgi:hypothetical protein
VSTGNEVDSREEYYWPHACRLQSIQQCVAEFMASAKGILLATRLLTSVHSAVRGRVHGQCERNTIGHTLADFRAGVGSNSILECKILFENETRTRPVVMFIPGLVLVLNGALAS